MRYSEFRNYAVVDCAFSSFRGLARLPSGPNLAFAGVEKYAVVVPTVFVTVLLPGLPGEQEDEGPAPGRRDAPCCWPP